MSEKEKVLLGGTSDVLLDKFIGDEDDIKLIEDMERKGHQFIEALRRGALPPPQSERLTEVRIRLLTSTSIIKKITV
jgi:hypothetical protein